MKAPITDDAIEAEVKNLQNVIQAIVKYQELQMARGEPHEEQDWTVDVARGRTMMVKKE